MGKGKSLVSFFLLPLIIGLALLCVVGAVLYYLGIQQPLEAQAKQLIGSQIEERADLIEQKINQIQSTIAVASQTGDETDEVQLVRDLKASIPQADQVQFFSPEDFQVNLDNRPIVTHVVVDLLRKSMAGEEVSPELILNKGQVDYVAFVHKLNDQRALMLTVQPSQMVSLLGAADPGTYFELRQSFAESHHTIAAVGTNPGAGNPLVVSPAFGANWTIAFWQGSGNFLATAGLLPILLMLGAVIALLIAALMPMLSLQRLLNKDARDFIQGIDDQHMPNHFSLKFFNDMASSYRRLAGLQEPAEKEQDDEEVVDSGLNVEDDTGEKQESARPKKQAPLNNGNYDLETLSHEISADIFREYDVRGRVDKDFDEGVVYALGLAIGSEAYARGEQNVVVARDGRLSSPELHEALKLGLIESGRNVIDLGMVPTPLLYFATHKLDTHSGVMLTGSHNPSNHNGLKVVLAGETLHGKDVKSLYTRIREQDFLSGHGQVTEHKIEQEYLEEVASNVKVDKPLKLVIDSGNGVTGNIAPRLFQALGCDVIGLHTTIDGNFPNHHPDPNHAKNLQDVIAMVLQEKADVGLAFDGDGDRLGVIDNQGNVIWTDRLMMLFAMDVLSRKNGAEIIYDVKCTRHLPEIIKKHGGHPIIWKTGHSLMKAKMQETGAQLGGEGSGHIYFKERWYGFDDALYAAARLLEILGKDPRSLAEVFEPLPQSLETEEINVPVADKIKFKLIEVLIKKAQFGEGRISTIDGIRVEYPDRWLLARASNTTPSIVVKFEADSSDALEQVKTLLREQLLAIAPKLKINF
ncbi:phosphomannomutase/phosphoglucomutase [Kangiella koreensis]|uniref:phosphomannomutase n=1 Tax=Kangiella koreensis (strain DSM 16069 / JCM 12317 / KCTC 12182 / SW-125) TaxID=523791 RepID=C7R7U6_KANKD|nr:phosphomannomutase/phosphoglucomutase [Kangiella koreensis]ACV27629.1 Phosphomannomutase [Kangiella koreensis DSM 16069]